MYQLYRSFGHGVIFCRLILLNMRVSYKSIYTFLKPSGTWAQEALIRLHFWTAVYTDKPPHSSIPICLLTFDGYAFPRQRQLYSLTATVMRIPKNSIYRQCIVVLGVVVLHRHLTNEYQVKKEKCKHVITFFCKHVFYSVGISWALYIGKAL